MYDLYTIFDHVVLQDLVRKVLLIVSEHMKPVNRYSNDVFFRITLLLGRLQRNYDFKCIHVWHNLHWVTKQGYPGLKAKEHLRYVNIGQRVGLVPSGTKPLPKPVLTNISGIKVMVGPCAQLAAIPARKRWQIVSHINIRPQIAFHYIITYSHTILRHGIFARYLKHLPNAYWMVSPGAPFSNMD